MEWRLKKIDKYIIKKFLLTFFFMLLFIMAVIIIFDISEKIDKFVTNKPTLHQVVFDYYINFIPYMMNMFSSLFVFITVIFFTSKMASNSEIIAILSGGVSYKRLLVPYIFCALLIAGVSLALNLWVIPDSNRVRLKFENEYVKNNNEQVRDLHYQISPNQFVYVGSFSAWNNTAYDFTIEEIKDNELVSKLSAESAKWDSTLSGWKLKNYYIRQFSDALNDNVKSGAQIDTVINLVLTDMYRNKNTVETLSYSQLRNMIHTQKMRGDANVMYAQIEKHTRFAMPFSSIILTIMGVCLSSRKKRGSMGWNLALGIALSFSYILFLKFSQMFVITGSMSAAMALWLPNIIYSGIALLLYRMAPK